MADQRKLDADRIARVCVDAIAGTVSVGPLEAIKLKGAFGRYKADSETKLAALKKFAELLSAEDFMTAATLADFLVAKVGK